MLNRLKLLQLVEAWDHKLHVRTSLDGTWIDLFTQRSIDDCTKLCLTQENSWMDPDPIL